MSQSEEILELDYDSPLENLFWFLGSPWCMGGTSLAIWFFFVSPGKNGRPPIWAEFPVFPFFLGMACIWALGFRLKANYDVRYQLDSRTQQLELVRKIFGHTFKSRIAEFSQLHSAAVMSIWSDDKQGNRHWKYALCLVTKSARMVRVSSYEGLVPARKAEELSRNLGIAYYSCRPQAGTLRAARGRDGNVTLSYQAPGRAISTLTAVLVIAVAVTFIIGMCFVLASA
ncbi:MAG: hypothetical protein KF760_23165 [Candidatus Eremiobacteraeota bacterium]|nr:hypothetical protein [Candidatus Eremiobacteraeota bacterium]MCW5870518.1 hypothetical protein [Candidatus Eremiobacteraeota bacterium]